MAASRPFTASIPAAELEELRRRVGTTRWPDQETVQDWEQGTPLAYARELANYWAGDYDWRRAEEALNQWPQAVHSLEVEGEHYDIHCIHVRSGHPEARPLVISHGWPGSVFEFLKVIDPLTNPLEHGGESVDAFHVVIPSLPGYGFSSKPPASGTSVERIADLWDALMTELGYDQYLAQGGDWGSMIARALALHHPNHCRGFHLNMVVAPPTAESMDNLTDAENEVLARLDYHVTRDSGYARLQSTRPQSLGYGLADSPVGQMAWIVEKFAFWTDCKKNGIRHPENALSRDEILDQVSLYWLTNTATSSARLYWESYNTPDLTPVTVPMGATRFPMDIFPSSERWARALYPHMVYWNEPGCGGHFAALEQPALFVRELRRCFRCMPW